MALALAAPDPAFLLVALLTPVWMIFVGRWLGRLAPCLSGPSAAG